MILIRCTAHAVAHALAAHRRTCALFSSVCWLTRFPSDDDLRDKVRLDRRNLEPTLG
jgi:hypothetical protein